MAQKLTLNPITGKLQFITVNNEAVTPYNILEGEIYFINEYKQDVFYEILVIDGIFAVDGKAYFEL